MSCGCDIGCGARKGTARETIETVVARVYPRRTWGELDDAARHGAGVGREEGQRMARALSEATSAPSFFRPGGDDDLCNFIYLLCLGREPSLVASRDGGAVIDEARVKERYLRICLSTIGRLAAIQEATMTFDVRLITETPRAGVFDPMLLNRTRRAVALLETSNITYLDFGLLDQPLEGSSPGGYIERFGVAPRLCNFLFFAEPPGTAASVMI